MEELSSSRPELLQSLGFTFYDMPTKAYRWIAEMEEISSFVASSLDRPGQSKTMGLPHEGLAALFERIAADLRATGSAVGGAAEGPSGDAAEIEVLHRFADEGKALLASKRNPKE